MLTVLLSLPACRSVLKKKVVAFPVENAYWDSPGRFEPEPEPPEPPEAPDLLTPPKRLEPPETSADGVAKGKEPDLPRRRVMAQAQPPDNEPLEPSPQRLGGGPTPQRQPKEAAPGPDKERLTRPGAVPRDHSPATLKRYRTLDRKADLLSVPDRGAAAPPEVEEGAVSAEPLSSKAMPDTASVPDIVIADLSAGSLRIQVTPTKDFSVILLDKVYPFVDRMEVYEDLSAAGAGNGLFWVRMAYVDLLEFQHPFAKPRLYRFTLVRHAP